MKKLTTLILMLFSCWLVEAQTPQGCGTEMPEETLEWLKKHVQESNVEGKMLRPLPTQTMVPIVPHLVRRDDGFSDAKLTNLWEEICQINDNYMDWDSTGGNFSPNFYFYPKAINIINDSRYFFNELENFVLLATHRYNDVVNIYLTDQALSGGNLVCGYFTGGQDAVVITTNGAGGGSSCFNNPANNAATLTHELGHYFSLPHPHSGWEGTSAGDWTTAPPQAQWESITPSGHDCYNCNATGDFFCDTPPDYNLGNVRWNCTTSNRRQTDSCLAKTTETTEITFASSNPADYAGTEEYINIYSTNDATLYSFHFDHPSNTLDPTTAPGTLVEVSLTGVASVADSIASAFARAVHALMDFNASYDGAVATVSGKPSSSVTNNITSNTNTVGLSAEVSLTTTVEGTPMNFEFFRDHRLWMSYSLDACPDRFSYEQSQAMLANLYNERADLLTSADPPIITSIATPNLSVPADNATGMAIDYVRFEWDAIADATLGYHIMVWETSPNNPVYETVSPTNVHHALNIVLDPNTDYNWRVKPLNHTYVCGGFSSTWEFETGSHFSGIHETPQLFKTIELFPNPVQNGDISIQLDSRVEGNALIQVYNVTGQEMTSLESNLSFGENVLEIDVDNLNAGLYTVQISIEGQSIEKKFIVSN